VIVLVSMMGYGDSLITLSLLERAGAAAQEIRVAGTGVTAAVSALLRRPAPPLHRQLFADVAAFYVVRERGPLRAAADFARFRAWSRGLGPGDTLIFEKADWRHRWLVPRHTCRVLQVPRATTAYADRERSLRPWLGEQPWPGAPAPRGTARRLLINPSARARDRELGRPVLDAALRLAAEAGTEVCLLDPQGRHEWLRTHVHSYLGGAPLSEAAAALRESDRYLGPDSFFMHLAYYYGKPQLALFHPHNMYFLPPGLSESGEYLHFGQAQGAPLQAALRRLLGLPPAAAPGA
jgi:hypothetical protein